MLQKWTLLCNLLEGLSTFNETPLKHILPSRVPWQGHIIICPLTPANIWVVSSLGNSMNKTAINIFVEVLYLFLLLDFQEWNAHCSQWQGNGCRNAFGETVTFSPASQMGRKPLFDMSPSRLSQCSHTDICAWTFSLEKKRYTNRNTWINYSYSESTYMHICINMHMDTWI